VAHAEQQFVAVAAVRGGGLAADQRLEHLLGAVGDGPGRPGRVAGVAGGPGLADLPGADGLLGVEGPDDPFAAVGRHPGGQDLVVDEGGESVQILRSRRPSGTPATDIMLNAHNTGGGTVRRYDGTVLKSNAYDTWFNVKIAHEASGGTGTIKVYLDDSLVLTVDDRGPATRYFKNGVYHHGSGRAEARFRNIAYWTR
jgi:hypothetical protein